MLCERGIRTYEEYVRNTLALAAVPELHRVSHLPVVVDPEPGDGQELPGRQHVPGRGGGRGGRADHRGPQRPGARDDRRGAVDHAAAVRGDDEAIRRIAAAVDREV